MLPRVLGVTLGVLAQTWSACAAAEEWSRAYISRLPDSAFAVVETAPDGQKVRHLPHHDETGAVDPAHLRAARARLPQVKWLDPPSEAVAPRPLQDHTREMAPGSPDRGRASGIMRCVAPGRRGDDDEPGRRPT